MDTSKTLLCDCNPCTCTNCTCDGTVSAEKHECGCGPQCACGESCACAQG